MKWTTNLAAFCSSVLGTIILLSINWKIWLGVYLIILAHTVVENSKRKY